jgi:hypothetical protein
LIIHRRDHLSFKRNALLGDEDYCSRAHSGECALKSAAGIKEDLDDYGDLQTSKRAGQDTRGYRKRLAYDRIHGRFDHRLKGKEQMA